MANSLFDLVIELSNNSAAIGNMQNEIMAVCDICNQYTSLLFDGGMLVNAQGSSQTTLSLIFKMTLPLGKLNFMIDMIKSP